MGRVQNLHKPSEAHLLFRISSAVFVLGAWGSDDDQGKPVCISVCAHKKRCELNYWWSEMTFKMGLWVRKSISGHGGKRLTHALSFNLCSFLSVMLRCLLWEWGT